MPSDSLLIREITNLREKLRISNARLGMFEASHPGQACAASHQLKMAKDALAASEAEVKAANERHAKSDWAREENWKACLEEKRKRKEAERALAEAQTGWTFQRSGDALWDIVKLSKGQVFVVGQAFTEPEAKRVISAIKKALSPPPPANKSQEKPI